MQAAQFITPRKNGVPSAAALVTASLLLFLLIAMPKGGVKIERIPITFSYLALGLSAAPCLAASVLGGRWGRGRVLCAVLALPLPLIVVLRLAANGYYDQGFALALVTNALVLPAVFIVCFKSLGPAMADPRLLRFLSTCALLVACFGLLEFAARNFFGWNLEVPYITVNAEDAGRIAFKHNMRASLVKLVSTYNNGNIFGVCMLLVGPVAFAVRPGRLWRLVYCLALFLTLSRTVWAGMLVWLVLWDPIYRRRPLSMLIRSPHHLLAALALGAAGIGVLSAGVDFIFDTSLGGRLYTMPDARWTLLGPDAPFAGIGEMTYTSFLQSFGLAGLLAFAIWLASPVIACLSVDGFSTLGPVRRAALVSLLVYMVVCAVDGAFLLIPVAALYWLMASYLLNPACREPDAAYRPARNSVHGREGRSRNSGFCQA
ncbi:MAG: hypothetical protein HY858_11510 [Candidatus Solibacter usitatus]|nr:hypothetical protein [Candidatus Solibacter usitatus]